MKQKIPFRTGQVPSKWDFLLHLGMGREARATTPKARLDVLVDVLDFGNVEGVMVALGVVLLVYRCVDKAFGLDDIGIELAADKDEVRLLVSGGAV